jgi:hypothetical protein
MFERCLNYEFEVKGKKALLSHLAMPDLFTNQINSKLPIYSIEFYPYPPCFVQMFISEKSSASCIVSTCITGLFSPPENICPDPYSSPTQLPPRSSTIISRHHATKPQHNAPTTVSLDDRQLSLRTGNLQAAETAALRLRMPLHRVPESNRQCLRNPRKHRAHRRHRHIHNTARGSRCTISPRLCVPHVRGHPVGKRGFRSTRLRRACRRARFAGVIGAGLAFVYQVKVELGYVAGRCEDIDGALRYEDCLAEG